MRSGLCVSPPQSVVLAQPPLACWLPRACAMAPAVSWLGDIGLQVSEVLLPFSRGPLGVPGWVLVSPCHLAHRLSCPLVTTTSLTRQASAPGSLPRCGTGGHCPTQSPELVLSVCGCCSRQPASTPCRFSVAPSDSPRPWWLVGRAAVFRNAFPWLGSLSLADRG